MTLIYTAHPDKFNYYYYYYKKGPYFNKIFSAKKSNEPFLTVSIDVKDYVDINYFIGQKISTQTMSTL